MIERWNEPQTDADLIAQKIAGLFPEYQESLLRIVATGVETDKLLETAMKIFLRSPLFHNAPEKVLEQFSFDLSMAIERNVLREYDVRMLEIEIRDRFRACRS
jgi:hypothetical protein